jgi:hypothetical protein
MPARGPVPKPSSQRRRVNKPEIPVETTPPAAVPAAAADFTIPAADPLWHPMAREWYESLRHSGQAGWYQPSDWAEAKIAAEILSRMLGARRLSAQLFAAWSSHTVRLLVTEGDRRRVRIELEKGGQADPDADAADEAMGAWQGKLAAVAS